MGYAKRSSVIAACFCIIGFALSLLAYYPGFLTSDTIDQYRQSLAGHYSDWHPPVMAILWHWLNKIYTGPVLMLVFQLLCLWVSCYILWTTVNKKIWHIWIAIFALAPFVQNFAGCVVKDSQMALSWLLAVAVLLRYIITGKTLPVNLIIFTALLLLYGTWVRPNAFPGAIPLYFLWAWVSFKKRQVRYTGWALLLVAGLSGPWLINTAFHVQKTHAESKLFLHDMAGIYVKTGGQVFPTVLFTDPLFDTANIRKHYHTATFDEVFWNGNDSTVIIINEQQSASIKKAWLKAVKAHPSVYLQNRFDGFLYFLRIKGRGSAFFYGFPWIHPNEFGYKIQRNFSREFFVGEVSLQKDMFYMRPWFWFFFNIVLLFLIPFIKHPVHRRVYIVMVMSGLLYQLPQFFVFQVDTEFRYFYWNCIICFLAMGYFIAFRNTAGETK